MSIYVKKKVGNFLGFQQCFSRSVKAEWMYRPHYRQFGYKKELVFIIFTRKNLKIGLKYKNKIECWFQLVISCQNELRGYYLKTLRFFVQVAGPVFCALRFLKLLLEKVGSHSHSAVISIRYYPQPRALHHCSPPLICYTSLRDNQHTSCTISLDSKIHWKLLQA